MVSNKRRIIAVIILLLCSMICAWWIEQHDFINVNNRFISVALLICVFAFCLIYLFIDTSKLIKNLILTIVAMCAFAFMLVPLYNVFCDVTGINGKMDLSVSSMPGVEIDTTRNVVVEFVVSHNKEMPWGFKPKHHELVVHPGELVTTAYYAKNPTKATMFAQAVPSMTPSKASRYFKKVECFCFSRQKLGPGEAAHLNLRFYLDPAVPKDVHRITLAYTIFDVTDAHDAQEFKHE